MEKKRLNSIVSILGASMALGGVFPHGRGWKLPQPKPERQLGPEDFARLEAAQAKRDRKAARRQGDKS